MVIKYVNFKQLTYFIIWHILFYQYILLMSNIPQDVWIYISTFIKNNIDTGNLMLTCSYISECKIIFNGEIGIMKIINSRWYDLFFMVILFSFYYLLSIPGGPHITEIEAYQDRH